MKIRWSDHAVSDLQSARDLIARDSDHYAAHYIEGILDAVERLETFPKLGRRVPEEPNDPNLRELIHRNHRIMYRLQGEAINIVTVVDARSDLEGVDPKPWEVG